MDIQWKPLQLPNISLYTTKLDDQMVDYLWSCIKQTEKDKVDISYKLDGNN